MLSLKVFFLLFCFQNIKCIKKQLCLNDDECLINAVIDRVYPRFVAGMPGVESSDPLHIDAIVADLADIKYSLFNATLSGLKNCEFLKINNERCTEFTVFDYALSCPVLTLQAEYELNGVVDSIPVEGNGQCKIVYENYYLSIKGKHKKVENNKGLHHVNILEYKVKPDLKKGNVLDPVYTNLIFKNRDLCSSHLRSIEEMTRDLVMDVFMNKYIGNLKKFHSLNPVEDLHFKYVQ